MLAGWKDSVDKLRWVQTKALEAVEDGKATLLPGPAPLTNWQICRRLLCCFLLLALVFTPITLIFLQPVMLGGQELSIHCGRYALLSMLKPEAHVTP